MAFLDRMRSPMDHPRRQAIVHHLRKRPGLSFLELRDRLCLANGSVTYHLRILEMVGVIVSIKAGRTRRYYMAATQDHRRMRAHAYTRDPMRRELLTILEKRRRCSFKEIYEETCARPRQTVQYHLGHLVRIGLIAKERDGRQSIYTVDAAALPVTA